MTSVAVTLARWAEQLEPEPGDLELAGRSLRDTLAVTLAARGHRVTRLAAGLPDGARWAIAGHVLDFDDLHMPSTTHISAVCVPTALATGGGPRAYLAAAGVMARLGTALGWRHYSAGWHATCTAGAPASAAGAAVALGLPADQDRRGHGAGRARRRRGPAGLRHGRQVAAGRLRRRRRDPGRPARGRGRAGRPRGGRRVAEPGRRRPGRGGSVRTGGTERSGDQALPVLLCAAAADQRPVRTRRVGACPEARSRRDPPDRAAHPGSHGGAVDPSPARPPGWRASSAWSTRPRPRCSTRIPGSAASPTRRSAGMPPGGWSAWSRSSSTPAGAGCWTASWRPRSTPVTGGSCGPASSSRRAPRRDPRRRPSCRPSWPIACAAWTPTRPRGPGITRQTCCGGGSLSRKRTAMDELNEDERAMVELVRDFVNREVRPVVRELEHANTYPDKLIEQMKQLGIFGLAIGEPWGDAQVSTSCYARITEELARGWMSLAGAMGGHTVVAKLLLAYGTQEQKRAYLPRMATGELRATMALTEPGGGSDLQALRTTARRDGTVLRHQRIQDLDHQRPPLRADRAAVQDQSHGPARARRHQHHPSRTGPRLHRLPRPAQAGLQGRGELRAHLRPTTGFPTRRCSASGRARGSRR